jgi:hypothetical protein
MGESSLERPRCFSGRLLTAEDLALEQQYFREKLKRHNRSLHGFGIVSGLKVNVNSGQIIVNPGLALDCEGNEIVIGEVQSIQLEAITAAIEAWRTAYVNIRYAEEPSNLVPVSGVEEASTVRESFEIDLLQENHNRGHRHAHAHWLTCGKPHALTIAKIRYGAQGWRVDRRYRAPAIK